VIAGLLLAVLLDASPPAVATPGPSGAADLSISGAFVRAGATFDAAARGRLSPATSSAVDPDKSTVTYSGFRLADVLHDAGAGVGDAVRGPLARAYVIVHAADGYGAVYSLAETQTSEARCAPLVANARNGAPLAPGTGPWRIVAPCDQTHARWVRGVVSLTIVIAPGSDMPTGDPMRH
jgi:hypothetical protein